MTRTLVMSVALVAAIGCGDDHAPATTDGGSAVVVGPGSDAGACERIHPDWNPEVTVGWPTVQADDRRFWTECLACPGVTAAVTRTWGPFPKLGGPAITSGPYCDVVEGQDACACTGADTSACDVGRTLFPSCAL